DNTHNTAFAGVISGSGGLTKVGSDSFTLSGSNSYTGPTNVGRTLAMGGPTNGGTLTVAAGGVLNNTPAAAGGQVNLNFAGVVLNGGGRIFGQVSVNASSSAAPSQVQGVEVTLPTAGGGTGITVTTGSTFVQVGTTAGVTVDGGNTTSTGLLVQA